MFDLRRRRFITLLGGAAVTGPLGARAQQAERVRRIGFLTNFTADDPGVKPRITAFLQGLQELGWIDGRNIRIDIRYGAGEADRARQYAAELVALTPDVMLASGGSALAAVKNATRMPIVFVNVTDPVGAGHVARTRRRTEEKRLRYSKRRCGSNPRMPRRMESPLGATSSSTIAPAFATKTRSPGFAMRRRPSPTVATTRRRSAWRVSP
jgi:ABC transporter substrate binding protein